MTDFAPQSRKHTVKLDSGKYACELVLPDHSVDLETDPSFCLAGAIDEGEGLVPSVEQVGERAVRLYVSRASMTGYRHVRAVAEEGGGFEVALYSLGRERIVATCASAVEAALAYVDFVADDNFQASQQVESALPSSLPAP